MYNGVKCEVFKNFKERGKKIIGDNKYLDYSEKQFFINGNHNYNNSNN